MSLDGNNVIYFYKIFCKMPCNRSIQEFNPFVIFTISISFGLNSRSFRKGKVEKSETKFGTKAT